MSRWKYTDKELKTILSNIVVLIDTREKSNKHITEWFDEKSISYENKKLDFGDYSFYIKAIPELGFIRDQYYDKDISIERKANLEEYAGNVSKDRARIEDEFLRHKGKMTLVIENSSYKDIWDGNYNTELSKQSFIATIHSFSDRYDVPFIFLDKECTPKYIYMSFYYFIRNMLK